LSTLEGKPYYLDRSSPRFGSGWVEFPIRCKASGGIVRLHKELVRLPANVDLSQSDLDIAVETTRKFYLIDHEVGKRISTSSTTRARAETKASR